MSRYQFSLAGLDDDNALRQRMAEDVMEGSVAVSFRRAPSYFAGSVLQGTQTQVIICKDVERGRVVGLGTRASLPAHINGNKALAGYLCDLRGDAAVRGGMLLARGFKYLRRLHADNPIPLYYSMILDGNESVLELLGSQRSSLPRYRSAGKFNTPALLLGGKRRHDMQACSHIRCANASDVNSIVQFVNSNNARYQFAPVLEAADFSNGRLAGLQFSDIYLAWHNDTLVGVTAAWDQRATRQIHIERYSTQLKWVKPFYNILSKMSALKPLPRVGQSLACLYLCLVAVKDDDAAVFTDLLEYLYEERRLGPWQMIFAGFHERHPLNACLEKFRQIKAAGQLFVVHWPDDQAAYDQLDGRVPHVEVGAL